MKDFFNYFKLFKLAFLLKAMTKTHLEFLGIRLVKDGYAGNQTNNESVALYYLDYLDWEGKLGSVAFIINKSGPVILWTINTDDNGKKVENYSTFEAPNRNDFWAYVLNRYFEATSRI